MPSEIKFSLRTKGFAQATIAANVFSELLLRFDKQLKTNIIAEIKNVALVIKNEVKRVLNGTNVNQILANMRLEDFDVEALSICQESDDLATLETAAPPVLRRDAEKQFSNFLKESEVLFDANDTPYKAGVAKIVRRKQFIGSLAQARHNEDCQKENELIIHASKFADFGIVDPRYIQPQKEIIISTLDQVREIYLQEEFGIDLEQWESDKNYRNAKENDRAKKLNESIKEAIFFLGDRPVNQYKSRDFDRMFKAMLNAPKARAKHHSSLTLEELEAVDWSEFKVTDKNGKVTFIDLQISPSTVDKHRQKIKQYFNWIIKRLNDDDETFDLIRVNPVQTKAIKKAHRSKSWAGFSEEDLHNIFTNENVTIPQHPWQFWIPVLSRATGARPNELAQLSINDVCQDTITLEGDSQPTTLYYLTIDDALAEQSTKNESSRRHVPLHPKIIELGFIDYVNDIRLTFEKGASLWPTLTPKNGYYTPAYSKWFTRKVLDNANVIQDRFDEDNCKKVTYSFRATFITNKKGDPKVAFNAKFYQLLVAVYLVPNAFSGVWLPPRVIKLNENPTIVEVNATTNCMCT